MIPSWDEVPGFFNESHRDEYCRLLESLPNNALIAEVGCYRGKSLCSAAKVILEKNIQIVAVDMFEDVVYQSYNEGGVLDSKNNMSLDMIMNLLTFNLWKQARGIIKLESTKAAKLFSKESFDLVFIDAAHDYQSVKDDIQAWYPLVKAGGIICGHDYADYCPGLVLAVKEIFPLFWVRNEIWNFTKKT